MPVYEYECKKCHQHFEIFQKISEKPKKKCRDCGGGLERLISQTSFSLKGGGWYRDGYAKKSSSKQEGSAAGKDKKTPTPKKASSKIAS